MRREKVRHRRGCYYCSFADVDECLRLLAALTPRCRSGSRATTDIRSMRVRMRGRMNGWILDRIYVAERQCLWSNNGWLRAEASKRYTDVHI